MIKVRKIVPDDEKLVSGWLERDPVHRAANIKWQSVIENGTEAFLIHNEEDNPLLAVRFHIALRAAMQFNPDTPFTIARHANEIVKWMNTISDTLGAKELIIRPGGKAVRFSEKLGFEDFNGKFIKI